MTAPAPPFYHHRRVEFSDTDMAGIVHFAVFFRYMEEAEHALLRSLGLSVFQVYAGATLSWPRVAAKCDFRHPARFGEVVEIAVGVARLGTKSATYRFVMTTAGRTVAVGELSAVCCHVGENHRLQSIAIPPEIAAKLATMAWPPADPPVASLEG